MNIFDYAMQIEKEGEELYTQFSKNAPNEGMTKIFTDLAVQERKHYEIFMKMKLSNDVEINNTPIWDNVKSIFAEWKSNKNKFDFDITQADLYRKALDIEKKSIDFYTEKSKEVKDVKQKQLFLKIADEEKKHYKIMENIIEFITMPDRWFEDAEFNIGEEF